MNASLDDLANRLNAWCAEHRLQPANGQAAETISTRTLRYYRTVGLMDAPSNGAGRGYAERHFLQAASVRVLQAQGLPLNRIHSLLFGRSDEDLRRVMKEGASAPVAVPPPGMLRLDAPESWSVHPLDGDFMLISRRHSHVPASVLAEIQKLLAGVAPAESHFTPSSSL